MATPPRYLDRRAQRTRQLVQQAALDVMKEKGFLAMTIQDIAERANVNRGTFYAHYTDKYALLEELIHQQFQTMLQESLPADAHWTREHLRLLIKTVLEQYEDEHHQCDPAEIVDPMIERASKEGLSALLSHWLERERRAGATFRVPIASIARTVSWTILGAASHWYEDNSTLSADQVAEDILQMVMDGIAPLRNT